MAEHLTTDKHLDGPEEPDAIVVRKGREETAPEAVDPTGRFRQRREGRAQLGEEHEEEN